jgi:hypothetical protein
MMKWTAPLVLSAGLALTGSSSAAERADAACRQALETLVSAWTGAAGVASSASSRTQLRQAREECAAGRVEAAVTRIAAASGVLAWLDLDERLVVATRHAVGDTR